MKIVLALLVLVLGALPASAQRRAQPFAPAEAALADSAAHRPPRPTRILVRAGTGVAGMTLGGAAGLAVGGLFVKRATRDGADDLGGTTELVLTTLLGGGLGIGLGSGLPKLGAKCGRLRRVTMGLMGGIVGASVVGYAGAVVDGERGTRFENIGFFAGAGLGAALGADC